MNFIAVGGPIVNEKRELLQMRFGYIQSCYYCKSKATKGICEIMTKRRRRLLHEPGGMMLGAWAQYFKGNDTELP